MVNVEEDNLHGVIVSSLQLLECCAGVVAFGAFSRFCDESSDEATSVPKREEAYALDQPRSAAKNTHRSSRDFDGKPNRMSFEAEEHGGSHSFANVRNDYQDGDHKKRGGTKQQQPVGIETTESAVALSEKRGKGVREAGTKSPLHKVRPGRHFGEDAHAHAHTHLASSREHGQHERGAPHDRDADKGQGSMHLNSPGAEQNDQHGGTQSQHLQMRGEERMSREEEQRRPSALGAHLHIVTQENQGEKHTNPPHTPKALNDSHQTQQSTPYTTTTNTSHHTTPHTTPHTVNTPSRPHPADSPHASIAHRQAISHTQSKVHATSPSHSPGQMRKTLYYEGGAGVQPPPAGHSAEAMAEAELQQQSDARVGDKSIKLSEIHKLAQSFASGEWKHGLFDDCL